MGETVDRVTESAVEWAPHIVRMRVNIAYMNAELRHLEDVADVEALVRGFETAFTLFCDEEMAQFVNARRLENDEITAAAFAAKARAFAESFEPWLGRFHAAVLRRREANDGLALALLHTCGAQLMDANRRFAAAVEAIAV